MRRVQFFLRQLHHLYQLSALLGSELFQQKKQEQRRAVGGNIHAERQRLAGLLQFLEAGQIQFRASQRGRDQADELFIFQCL